MTNSAKSLSVNACATLGISPEQLRSLLSKIEAQLHHSEVYRRTLEAIQTQSGEQLDDIQMLIKAMGREAIRISLQNLVNQTRPQSSPTESSPLPISSVAIAPVTIPQPSSAQPTTQSSIDSALGKVGNVFSARTQKLSKAQLALEKVQQEKETAWKVIGEQLQKARYGRSLSLEQLYALTRIPLHELKALENGDLHNLPEEVYIRGFVRRLSIVLGLDSQKLLSTLPEPDTTHSVIPSWYRTPTKKNKGMYLQPAHLYLGYTALMAGAVGGLALLYGEAPSGAATDQPDNSPQLSTPDAENESYAADALSTKEISPPEVSEPAQL